MSKVVKYYLALLQGLMVNQHSVATETEDETAGDLH
jgi:hypothetical protein